MHKVEGFRELTPFSITVNFS
uniref:Uncharacterized protein n=1 Tax=Rhizophora mucronata TaxID=61149 RepID=A0A2P2PWB2_RHIMU